MGIESTTVTEGDILPRAIESIRGNEWRQVATFVCKMSLPERDLDRVDELLEKNRSGAITAAERDELDRYLRVGNFLSLLKARAARTLAEHAAA